MASLAEQKKLILPYLQRADEINKLNPKVAYYCRLYAIQQGIQIQQRVPEIESVLEALMEKLEQDRPKLNITSEDAQICEAFAVTVFNRADKQDRAGKADMNTVKAFYVATVFIEILRQFGELPPDMAERQQYAAWKAADIRKALREGRMPDPGPPIKDDLMLNLPDIPGSRPGGIPGDPTASDASELDLPSAPSTSAPGPGPSPQGAVTPEQRFRPGSKVYYNATDGPPAKGTVFTVFPYPAGAMCRVGLSQQVVDVPVVQLAHDFATSQRVRFQPKGGPLVEATVEKIDASRWPIAYLVTSPDGKSIPTAEDALSPILEAQTPPLPPPAAPRSSSTSPTRRQPGTTSQPTPPAKQGSTPPVVDDVAVNNEATEDVREDGGAPAQDMLHEGDGRAGASGIDPTGASTEPHQDSTTPSNKDLPAAPIPPSPPFARARVGPSGSHNDMPAAQQPAAQQPEATYPNLSSPPEHHLPSTQPPSQPGMPNLHQPSPQFSQPGGGRVAFAQGPPQTHSYYPGQPAAWAPPPATTAQPLATAAAGYEPPLQAITEAQKLAKYAASSLSFEDVPTALKHLQRAYELLTVPAANK